MYVPESTLIDTQEGIQCKVYASSHPKEGVIVKPKYIPVDLLELKELKKRYILEKCMHRFNLFNSREIVNNNLNQLKEKYPYFYHEDTNHKNWFLIVPKEKIKKQYDSQEGLKQLMKVPEKDLDPYLKATRGIIEIMLSSGVPSNDLGISHSTLLGNYTLGKSDIDILVFGKENGWCVLKHMEKVKHPLLKWKTEEEWAKYYQDRIVSSYFSKEEYVFNMVRKRDDGFFDGNVFSIFIVEKENETWYDWDEKHEPLATVKIQAEVEDDSHAHIRPGYYGIKNVKVLEGYKNIPIKRIVVWSRPFVLQAKKGEEIEAVGLLEHVKSKEGEFYQIVIGYFDTYTTKRGDKEYLKARVR